MSYQIGDRIGDYQVVDVLGAGGMGKVYKVRNIISERVEAMKVLLPNLESDPELADRFMREIKVQASLQHPNIAALHTAQRVNNQLLMIMEFVEGSSLEGELRKGRIAVEKGIDYISQALSALGYAHERGVVHRDIKPANMMVTPAGVVKLMDFGIAKVTADRRLTQTGRTMGSLYYMSPEQIQGAIDLDGRADIYSLGVSLYEIVTRTRPFQGDSDYSIMAAHLGAKPVPPIELDPTLPEALNDVILMAIAKDPNQRFQNAEAFRAALQNVRASIGRVPIAPSVVAGAPGMATSIGGPISPPVIPGAASVVPEPVIRQGSGRRGLYMAIGSVITVAVLAVAAIQGPKLFKSSSAQTTDVPAPVVSSPASSSAASSQVPTVPPPLQQPLANEPQRQIAQAQTRRPPAQNAAPRSETPPVETPQSAPQPTAAAQVPPGAPLAPQQSPSAQVSPQQPPAADAAKQTALRDLRRDLMLLGTRANAIKGSLATMKREQSRQGLNLRGDIVASEQQMEVFLDDAEGALRSGDADKMKENLEAAERQVEKLEKFLGR